MEILQCLLGSECIGQVTTIDQPVSSISGVPLTSMYPDSNSVCMHGGDGILWTTCWYMYTNTKSSRTLPNGMGWVMKVLVLKSGFVQKTVLVVVL